jgi:superfamily II DNA or RNA helicase
MVTLAEERLRAAQGRIGASWLARGEAIVIGGIVLRDAQREAAARVSALLDAWRGCLLADDVGRGKTFVALAVSRRWARGLVVVPAGLADTWRLAMARAEIAWPLVTHESLSRGHRPGFHPDGVIVDESHHFRNPSTQRYSMLAEIVAHAELLLLSATPIQNSVADLAAQLALFLGAAVVGREGERLAPFVVRVQGDDAGLGLPVLDAPRWLPAAADDSDVLRAILDLPPPPRALDAGDAGVLRTITLVRAWASSRAALQATLARRRRTAVAMEQSVHAGRMPTTAELRAWHGAGDDAVQLGFAELLVAQGHGASDAHERSALMVAISSEHAALDRLASLLRRRHDVDHARAAALAEIVRAHRGARVLAFTELASTARGYHALLRYLPGVGLLTASGATIASGRITRRELLERFAPVAQGVGEAPPRERVTLLISTDLLSEGVNLQDAAVVVHLDLPWNPARLAQRVGRIRRPHGAARVSSYLVAPPAGAELLLDVERRLRGKLRDAERTIGRSVQVVPTLTLAGAISAPVRGGTAGRRRATEARLRAWRDRGGRVSDPLPLTAAAASRHAGWIAVLGNGELIAALDGQVGTDAGLVDRASAAADCMAREVDAVELERALVSIARHLERRRLLDDCGLRDLVSPAAGVVLRQASSRIRAAPRHQRVQCAALAARLREVFARPCSLGTERALARLVNADGAMSVVSWLEQVLAVAEVSRRSRAHPADAASAVEAIVLFGP